MTMAASRRELANALRVLAMDAVEAAGSGHPGMPMGMADIAEVLWRDVLRHDPADPHWPDRDRFVLSNGHGSMLLYGLLHLSGYALPVDELRRFRQLGAMTPGHPEYGCAPGVETTTGPLGQGFANAVGMAIAERRLAAEFNRPGHTVVDHRTYAFAGDGCLMEGISHEAASLAGTLRLGKLTVVYDDNGISIDGPVHGWFTEDVPRRFEAYGWHVIPGVDGHDVDAVAAAFVAAGAETERPTLICCRTRIGFGAPRKAGTAAAHGAALGGDEVAATRAALGWPYPPFEIPQPIYDAWDARVKGAEVRGAWQRRFDAYRARFPELAGEFERRMAGALPADFERRLRELVAALGAAPKKEATRQSSQRVLAALGAGLPELLGGSADLTDSNKTQYEGQALLTPEHPQGSYLHYGVRELAMVACMNGIALHRGLLPYGGTFLVFTDYARSAIRLAALMGVRTIVVASHDSIGLGEDGPTHQPIEHLASLRLIPNLDVWRPCDAVETAAAWGAALARADGPSVLALSRQGTVQHARDAEALAGMARGGYVLRDCDGPPALVFIATGAEVGVAAEAAAQLAAQGVAVRVVSMPCVEVFERQDAAYRAQVLPETVGARVVVEAGASGLWWRYAGAVLGLDRFGESAPADTLLAHFGFTASRVAALGRETLARASV
jgi:transketolase